MGQRCNIGSYQKREAEQNFLSSAILNNLTKDKLVVRSTVPHQVQLPFLKTSGETQDARDATVDVISLADSVASSSPPACLPQ